MQPNGSQATTGPRAWVWRAQRLALALVAAWAGAPAVIGLLFPGTVVKFAGGKPLTGSTAIVAVIELCAMRLGVALVAAWAAALRRPPGGAVWGLGIALALGAAFLTVAGATGMIPAGELTPYRTWMAIDLGLGLVLVIGNLLRRRG